MFKYSETIEYVKNLPTFYEIYKLYRKMTREFFGLRFSGYFFNMNTNI